MRKITVGSRKSGLALMQSNWVINQLENPESSWSFDIKKITTKGDRILDVTLSKIGGKGLFVKEIERALLEGEIDMAVHSMKDMPSLLPEGLMIGCIPPRVDPRDVMISEKYSSFAELPNGAIVGTSSLRRGSQLLASRPDLIIEPIRGNIDTRLAKLKEGPFDAIILASAGLARMGWSDDVVTEYLDPDLCLPAVGQGALAIECRQDDQELLELLRRLNDSETSRTVMAERAFLKKLEGGCQTPIAAMAEASSDEILLKGLISSPDGKQVFKDTLTGTNPEQLGYDLGNSMIAAGAKEILDAVKEEESD